MAGQDESGALAQQRRPAEVDKPLLPGIGGKSHAIDFERILRMAEPPPPKSEEEIGDEAADSAQVMADAADLDVEEGELAEGEEAGDGLTDQITTWSWRTAAPGVTTFVTVGRLSPEKNQERLIRAFARVHADHPDTRLIILGGGPILGKLRDPAMIAGPLRGLLSDTGLLAQRVARQEAPRDTAALQRSIGLEVAPLYARVSTPLDAACSAAFSGCGENSAPSADACSSRMPHRRMSHSTTRVTTSTSASMSRLKGSMGQRAYARSSQCGRRAASA
jgi:hypothetical protein